MATVRGLGVAILLVLTTALLSRSTTAAVAAPDRAGVHPPARLVDTGLYKDGRVGTIADNVLAFSPQYPLWSDGAIKSRWIHLPPGAAIDATRTDDWDFPVGTRLWKQFDFGGRPVETRMLWKASASRWVFATYVWNEDGTDAVLAPAAGVPGAAEISSGRRHDIPSIDACTSCHGARHPRPLGFNALQLSDDRDPNAIHGEPLQPGMVTLTSLVKEGRLSPGRTDLLDAPPRIRTANPATRTALGYLLTNCGSCHNGNGEIAARTPVFRYRDVLEDGDAVVRALVDAPTHWQVPGAPEGASAVISSHNPAKSALLLRMRSRRPSSQMPPIGTVVRDDEAVQAIATWIEQVLQVR